MSDFLCAVAIHTDSQKWTLLHLMEDEPFDTFSRNGNYGQNYKLLLRTLSKYQVSPKILPKASVIFLNFYLSDEVIFRRGRSSENFKIFSNPLFDLDEEITSTKVDQIDDEVLENTNSIPPGNEYPCFNAESDLSESLLYRDTLINDSQKIDSLLDEFTGELTLPHSIPPGIDDVNLDPEGDILFWKDSDSLMEEIDIFLDGDGSIPQGIESDDFDLEDDDNSTSRPEFESFHVDYPDSGDSTIDVVEDIPVDVPNILPTHPAL
ncbi:hypothetical protein Tco_1096132 [Tanacetum coccineum]